MMSNKAQTLIEAFPRIKAFITSLSYLHPSRQESVFSVIVQLILWSSLQCRYHCSLFPAPSFTKLVRISENSIFLSYLIEIGQPVRKCWRSRDCHTLTTTLTHEQPDLHELFIQERRAGGGGRKQKLSFRKVSLICSLFSFHFFCYEN